MVVKTIRSEIKSCTALRPPQRGTALRPPQRGTANIPANPIRDSNNKALFDKTILWGKDGTIQISFQGNSANSTLGELSDNVNTGQPSMRLGWLDPPLEGFKMDGFNFEFNVNGEYRNGCSIQNCNKGDKYTFKDGKTATCFSGGNPGVICDDNYIPGGVVLHEFGHAMGLYHEHQNFIDSNPIEYDIDGVTINWLNQLDDVSSDCIRDYCKLLCFSDDINPSFCKDSNNQRFVCDSGVQPDQKCINDWERAKEIGQFDVLDTYSCPYGRDNCNFDGSVFDPDSIMLYTISDYMIKKGTPNPTKLNYQYSAKDKEYLRKMYPVNSNGPSITIKFLDGQDWEKYWVKKVVTEQLAPYVGLNFIFDLPINSDPEITITESPSVTQSPVFQPPIISPNEDIISGLSDYYDSFVYFFNNNKIFSISVIVTIIVIFVSLYLSFRR